ncbi:MAG: glycoside hydrolase family 2 protein, partial [Clostridia bacterium]|nr:glycoside hydrolase family 2 protein [Clostridia bacterium]
MIPLNGAWQGEYKTEKEETFAFPATVPGCVHTDLQSCGRIGDFYYRDNSKGVQWIENCDVTYRREFEVDAVESGAFLEFDGLDTYCEIYLNGQKVGEGHNMFVPHAFPVDGVLKAGTNRLEVRFFSPIRAV